MNWQRYLNGYLTETKHGFYFVYEEFGLWYIEFEIGAVIYGDGNGRPLTLHGFRTLEIAQDLAKEHWTSLGGK